MPEDLRKKISSNLFKKYVGMSEEVLAHEIYLNYDKMKCMKHCGMFFCMHGYDHYWMNKLDHKTLTNDIIRGLDCMKGLLDENHWVMNYPYGSYSDDVMMICKEKGCVLGLSTEVRIADLQKDNPFALPRLDTNDFPPKGKYGL